MTAERTPQRARRGAGKTARSAATAYIISHTHWDREWYQPFQSFRKRLVYQLSELIRIMERDPSFKYYHLDGQTRVVRDFSDACPEMAGRLAALIRAGRILIGPWYVMPDEFLVSGESLIRNLLFGHRECRRFGCPPLPVGYVTDIFGHISQFPQLLRGFGIDAVLLHRGTSGDGDRSEMVWYGADGSAVLLLRVNLEAGYGDLRYTVWDPTSSKFTGSLEERLRRFINDKRSQATTNVWLALEGNDHTGPYADLAERIRRLNALAGGEVRFVHASFPEYLRALRRAMGSRWHRRRPAVRGELRSTAKTGWWNELLTGTGSSRPDLKFRNDQCEWLLTAWAEPWDVWNRLSGGDAQQAFLEKAWEYLLLNQPHDSICGCSIDQVHRDMHYRYDQCRIIAEDAVAESVREIAVRVDTARLPGDRALVVCSALSAPRSGVVIADVEWPSGGVGDDAVPVLYRPTGAPIPVQVLAVERNVRSRYLVGKMRGELRQYGLVADGPHHRWTVAFPADLPAHGYTTFGCSLASSDAAAAPLRVRVTGNSMENELVRVGVNTDGTVDITDLRTGHVLSGGLLFADDGDAGDGWNHRVPAQDRCVVSGDGAARCTALRQGLVGTIRIALTLRVPAELDRSRTARADEYAELPVTADVTLYAGEPFVDFAVTVDNRARDHRLRVLFPTGLRTDTWHADTAFDLVERPVRLPDTAGWQEPAVEYHPFKNLLCAADGRVVVCAVTRGITEGCVRDDAQRSMALTLFRAFREVLFHEATQDSQLPGTREFAWRMFVLPQQPGWRSQAFHEAEWYKTGVRTFVDQRRAGDLPEAGSFLQVSGPLVLSAVKRAESDRGYVVRAWNPDTVPVTGEIRFGVPLRSARLCRLDETAGKAVRIRSGNTVALRLAPKEIQTLHVVAQGSKPSRR